MFVNLFARRRSYAGQLLALSLSGVLDMVLTLLGPSLTPSEALLAQTTGGGDHAGNPGMRVEMRVEGLTSPESADDVARVLKRLNGVIDVAVDHETGLVIITMEPDYPVSMVTIIATLQEAGYSVPGVPGADENEVRAPGQLNALSRNAAELKELFNANADKVRLIMLLAPS